MSHIVQAVPVGARICDMYSPLTLNRALSLKASGVDGVGRYLDNLTTAELDAILSTGMGCFGIRTADNFDGPWMVAKAQQIGFPAGVTLAIDDEANRSPEPQIFAEIDKCAADIALGSYLAMLYWGWESGLTAAQGSALPNVHRYWRSASFVPEPDNGFCLYQLRGASNVMRAGTLVDVNMAELDKRGRAMTWCVAA